jgi:hypothetical protein
LLGRHNGRFSLSPNRRQFVNARDGEGAVADGKADAFGGTGADVAGGEDSGEGGFEGAGFAVFQGPSAAAEGVDAGEDVAEVVAGDGFGKPGAAGVRADEDEGRGDTEDFVGVVGLGVVGIAVGVVGAEGDGFQAGRAVDGGDFDAFGDGDVFGGASVVFAPFWDQYRRQQC